jgi:hypothetical protein
MVLGCKEERISESTVEDKMAMKVKSAILAPPPINIKDKTLILLRCWWK